LYFDRLVDECEKAFTTSIATGTTGLGSVGDGMQQLIRVARTLGEELGDSRLTGWSICRLRLCRSTLEQRMECEDNRWWKPGNRMPGRPLRDPPDSPEDLPGVRQCGTGPQSATPRPGGALSGGTGPTVGRTRSHVSDGSRGVWWVPISII